MNGTIFSVTRAMDLIPPMITIPTRAANTSPTTNLSPASGLSAPPVTSMI